jgi:predicted acylesterase/phospholipase RssA
VCARSVVAVTLSALSGRAFTNDENHQRRRKSAGKDAVFGPVRRWQIAAASVDIMERRIAAIALEHADAAIAPDLERFTQLAFLDAVPLIARGEAAAEQALPRVLDLLK